MTASPQRRDGWTPDRTARFLDTLSHKGNVARAAAAIGLSREAAYCRRRRDPLFARGWAAAMVLAREEGGHILADRALNGVEEQVWFRGEVVGTRIRYDNRLLLAHIARLDRLALDENAQADAARFDELVARCAGAEPPIPLAANDDLPPTRASFMEQAAEQEAYRQEEEAAGGFGEDEWERERREAAERIEQARTGAGEEWDQWTQAAFAQVDALLGTVSDLSTSPPPADPEPPFPIPLVLSLSEDAGESSPPACAKPAILRQAQDERSMAAGSELAPQTSRCPPTSTDPQTPTPLVLSLSKDAGTTPANRAERRRRGRKARPAIPATRSGRHAPPRLQRRP